MSIQDRLENWSRWARTSRFIPSSCKSLENRYRSPQHWNAEEPKMPIDLNDALRIEKGLISINRYNMNLLIYCYIKSSISFDSFCYKNKIKGNKIINKNESFTIEQIKSETILQLMLDSYKI